jgi:hypothetical protein
LINLFEYAFNTNPNVSNGPPVAYGLVGGHLSLHFQRSHPAPADISYLFDVTADLASGPWQSGPAFTSQTVTDNQDGTETVVVTDNMDAPSSTAHYLRLRISRP